VWVKIQTRECLAGESVRSSRANAVSLVLTTDVSVRAKFSALFEDGFEIEVARVGDTSGLRGGASKY
jgi:hypothetical protein